MTNDECKLYQNFKYHLRKTATARRPDVTIKYKNKNNIFLIDMACSNNVDTKHAEKLQKIPTTRIRDHREGRDQGTM